MHEGRPVLTRPYRGDGSFGPFVNFLHRYSGWPPRLRSNYGKLRSPIAETEAGVRYFVETLDRARHTTEHVPFQRNTGEELTDSLDTPLSWVPVLNTDPPAYDGEENIEHFRIYARPIRHNPMWLGLGHDDGTSYRTPGLTGTCRVRGGGGGWRPRRPFPGRLWRNRFPPRDAPALH